MATKGKDKAKGKKQFVVLHKITAATSLLSLFVIVAAGMMAQASVFTMAFRSMVVIVVVGIIHRVLVQILLTYEEMSSG